MPEVGHEAPDFSLSNQHGETVTLSQYRGQKNVVLVFYPWAFTGPCTGELCAIRDQIADFDNDDTVTLAVSCDAKFSLRIFSEQEGLRLPAALRPLAAWGHGSGVRRLQRGPGGGPARDVHHRQGRRGALEGRQRDPRRP